MEKKIKEIDLPNSNLYLYGFGKDINGNSTIKLSIGSNKPFSIQINNPEFYKHTYDKRSYSLNELSENDILGIEKDVIGYIKKNGNKEKQNILKVYTDKYELGGDITNERFSYSVGGL